MSREPNWSPQLTKAEFDCSHTGKNEMDADFIDQLQRVRDKCGFPWHITSGYRDPTHPIEARKAKPGRHTYGVALDIGCHSDNAYWIIKYAMEEGISHIGVSQVNGKPRFIHLGMVPAGDPPRVYSY